MNKLLQSFTAGICLISFTTSAGALGSGGWSNVTGTSARAAGFGYAFAGVADDPSAINYNPAGLVQSKGWQVMTGAAILQFNMEHTTPAGVTDRAVSHHPVV